MNDVNRMYASQRTIELLQRVKPGSEVPAGFVGLVLASDYDALAQRCRELEAERNHFAIQAQRFYNERNALRAEVADLKARLEDQA